MPVSQVGAASMMPPAYAPTTGNPQSLLCSSMRCSMNTEQKPLAFLVALEAADLPIFIKKSGL
jgi:hypothetical protein